MENQMLFVSAFKDIGRTNWNCMERSTELYIELFLKLALNLDEHYKLVVYMDDEVKEKIALNRPNIIFKNIKEVDTFLDRYLDTEEKIISSEIYQNKVPQYRKHHPEHWCAAYNLINHSKINFVRHAQQCYPGYEFYSWIDFGYVRDVSNVPRVQAEQLSRQPHKIIYQCFEYPNIYNKISGDDMLASYDIYLAGSSFLVHHSLVKEMETLYENKIKEWHQSWISDDDQNLILQIYYDHPEMFHLLKAYRWQDLYNIL